MSHTALPTILDKRQEIKDQIDELKAQLNQINAQIVELVGVGTSVEIDDYTIAVRTRRTFNAGLAEGILAKKRMSKEVRRSLYKAPVLDGAKVKALFPVEWEKATVESDPIVTVR